MDDLSPPSSGALLVYGADRPLFVVADDHAWSRRISLIWLVDSRFPDTLRCPSRLEEQRPSSATSPRPWGVGVAGVDDAVGIQQPVAGLELFVPDLERSGGHCT